MPKDKCKFQDCWLRDKKYQKWIRKKNDNTAYCTYCWKEISINHLGEPALKSHLLSKKHIERSSTNTTSSVNMQLFLPEASRESSESKASEGEIEEPKTQKDKQTTINQSFSTLATIAAEIWWVLKLVCAKHSMNSLSNSGALFTAMFPDHEIAKHFQCGHTKAGYVAHFGFAPYFNDIFYSQIPTCPYYAVSFDESLNDVVQKDQMDLNV